MALTQTPPGELGTSCPDFKAQDIFGKSYQMQDFFKGQPVVFMFICNHCPYVIAIEDRLLQLGEDLKKLEVPLVGICSNDGNAYPADSLANLQLHTKEKGFNWIYLHDPTQEIAKKFAAVCTPDFFVFDKNQSLAYRGRLDDSWKDAAAVKNRELYRAVLTLLNGKPVPAEQNFSMGCSIKWIKS